MDLSYSPEYEAFRDEVRAFAKDFGDRAPRGGTGDMREWQTQLITHGYAARTIPKEYGGYGAERRRTFRGSRRAQDAAAGMTPADAPPARKLGRRRSRSR